MPSLPIRSKTVIGLALSGQLLLTSAFPLSTAAANESGNVPGSPTRGQAGQDPTPANRNSKVISLLLQAGREENPERALLILGAAREELKKERLSNEDSGKILGLIDSLEQKVRAKIALLKSKEPQKDQPTSRLTGELPVIADLTQLTTPPATTAPKSTSPATPSGSTNVPVNIKEVETTLASNPDMRDALWEIGRGRLSRDAQNLTGIIEEKTGKTPEQLDAEDAKARAEGYKPGLFLEMLGKVPGLNIDVSKANLQLKQEFDGISLDILADKLINDATRYSIPVGVLQGLLSDIGTRGRFLGVSSEVFATFLINAKLALRLSDLYGVELADSEKEIVLLVVFAAAKFTGQYGANSAAMSGTMSKFGETLGRLKFGGAPGQFVEFLKRFSSNPAVIKAVGPALTNGPLVSSTDTAKAESETQNTKKRSGLLREIAGRLNLMGLLKSGLHGARSATETYAVGHAAKYIFRGARLEKRAIHNENFRRFLMTPTAEGFLKLMVLSMSDGRPSTLSIANRLTQAEAKAKIDFVVNIARSARICSPTDKTLATAKAKYACQANPNTARFERLQTEMLTYDEIPQVYVTDLRLVSREHRLRMADLILQMQFLDGDRSPSENLFFRHVVAKALGVDQIEELDYFDRVHAFIQENGGLIPSSNTPTGITVRSDSVTHPYDMDQGYTPLNSPEPAAGPRYVPSTKTPGTDKSTTSVKPTDKAPEKTADKAPEKPAAAPAAEVN